MSNIIIVSACLLGLPTRYDGCPSANEEVLSAIGSHIVVPVCPEQLGGLPTPRPAHFLDGGTGEDALAGRTRVINDDGGDVTEEFLRGARTVVRIAELVEAREAWFKEESPSCGVRVTSHGEEKVPGPGVTTALLRSHGIRVRGFD